MNLDDAIVRKAAETARTDGELRLFGASWEGTLTLVLDGAGAWRIPVARGQVGDVEALSDGYAEAHAGTTDRATSGVSHVRVSAPASTWLKLLAAPPPPMFTDIFGAALMGAAKIDAPTLDPSMHNAIRRMTELLRHAAHGTDPAPVTAANVSRHGMHEAATGRYIHLDLGGVDHRVYYEEAGTGIGLLCQHTAGADGRQWRHLLEDAQVTRHFRVIAYDLPFHGKSLPPESTAWWAEEYRLTTAAAMALPVALAHALGMQRPVFMGSSIGGHLALDLGAYHADDFRAVVSLEGALKMERNSEVFPHGPDLRDPAGHAALMMALMAPQAPERFRHETRLQYAQGAPGVFPGDIHYYFDDHDLRDHVARFDTRRCPVYMLTGEYDAATAVRTLEAAQLIKGARAQIMKGLGHFPMSEDYPQLMQYLRPILDEIAESGG